MYHVYCVYIMYKQLIACDQTGIPFFGYFLGGVKNLAAVFMDHSISRGKTKKCQSERLPNSWRPYKARNGFMVQ